jgi:hypothetical protein
LKDIGYFISILSVLLIGVASWRNAANDPLLLTFLVAGIATSVIGMALRWITYRRESR